MATKADLGQPPQDAGKMETTGLYPILFQESLVSNGGKAQEVCILIWLKNNED